MEVLKDNVVGRLYHIIKELKENKRLITKEAFCKVFSLEDKNNNDNVNVDANVNVNVNVNVFECYAELYKMAMLGMEEIEKYNPKHKEKYIKTLNRVIDGLSKIYFDGTKGTMNNGMEVFDTYFDSQLMLLIENCADYLSEKSQDTIIEEKEIINLIKEIDDLVISVLELKLDKELEYIIIFSLNNIKQSLLKYKLFGNEGIKDSLTKTFGSIMLNYEKIQNNDNKGALSKVFNIIDKINALINLGTGVAFVLEALSQKQLM